MNNEKNVGNGRKKRKLCFVLQFHVRQLSAGTFWIYTVNLIVSVIFMPAFMKILRAKTKYQDVCILL